MSSRAEIVYGMRFHGGPEKGPLAHPTVHDGGGKSKKKKDTGGFGNLKRGANTIRVRPMSEREQQAIGIGNSFDKPKWITIWKDPTEAELKRLVDPDETWEMELRFMVDRETGSTVVWDANEVIHTQVTQSLWNTPAWAVSKNGKIDIWSDYTIPVSEFYETLRHLKDAGEFDQPDWSELAKDRVVIPRIIR